jgi:hypothetical protein
MAQHYVEKAEDHAYSAHKQIRNLTTRIDSLEGEVAAVPFFCNKAVDDDEIWRRGWASPSFEVAPGLHIRLKFSPQRHRDRYFLGIDVVEGYNCQIFGKASIIGYPQYITFGSRASPLKFPRESDGEMNWCWGKIFTITEAQRIHIGARFILRAKVYVHKGLWSYLAC